MPEPRKKWDARFYNAAEKLNSRLEGELESWPWFIKAIFVFALGGIAGEMEDEKPYLAYFLLGLGLFVALGAIAFGSGKPKKPDRRQHGKR